MRSGKAANPGTGQWKSNSTITSCPAGGGGGRRRGEERGAEGRRGGVIVCGSGIFSKCMLGDLATCYSTVEKENVGISDNDTASANTKPRPVFISSRTELSLDSTLSTPHFSPDHSCIPTSSHSLDLKIREVSRRSDPKNRLTSVRFHLLLSYTRSD